VAVAGALAYAGVFAGIQAVVDEPAAAQDQIAMGGAVIRIKPLKQKRKHAEAPVADVPPPVIAPPPAPPKVEPAALPLVATDDDTPWQAATSILFLLLLLRATRFLDRVTEEIGR
jgi:hypothetical protein